MYGDQKVVKRSLVIHDLSKFHEAIQFQHKIQPEVSYRDSFMGQVAYLLGGHYGGADELHLTRESTPHSFGFAFYREGKPVSLAGAILLHGCGENFAASLDQGKPRVRWEIHT